MHPGDLVTPAYVRTMAAYNAEMNRRIYEAASRIPDAQRRESRGAFWGSLHGTLCHLLWGDRVWMARFDHWPATTVAQKDSATLVGGRGDRAAIDARDEDHESTPAQWRIDKAPEVSRFLLTRGATPDLFLAAALGDVELAARLIAEAPLTTGRSEKSVM